MTHQNLTAGNCFKPAHNETPVCFLGLLQVLVSKIISQLRWYTKEQRDTIYFSGIKHTTSWNHILICINSTKTCDMLLQVEKQKLWSWNQNTQLSFLTILLELSKGIAYF